MNDHFLLNTEFQKFETHHKRLLNVITRLEEMLERDSRRWVVRQVMGGLLDFICFQFRAEENFMQTIDFSGRSDHKREHDELLTILQDRIVLAIPDTVNEERLMRFVSIWLPIHIAQTDGRLFEFAERVMNR